MASLRIDKDYFIKRASKIYETWSADTILSSVQSLVFVVGTGNSDDVQYSKSFSLQTWLYNCSLPDTLIVFTKTGIHFLGSDRKAQFFSPLETLRENLHDVVPPFTIYNRNKTDKDAENFERMLNIISNEGQSCGYFAKDKPDSTFAKSWENSLKNANKTLVDVSLSFAKIFAVKDEMELKLMKQSSMASVNAWSYLKKKIVDIVDTEKRVKHSRLAEEVEKEMVSVAVQGALSSHGSLEPCYTPIIQSGDQSVLKFSAESNDKVMSYGAMTCSIGARYLSYCSNIGRTIMVMPTPGMEEAYEHLLSTQTAIIDALKPGAKLCDVYSVGLKHFEEKKNDFLPYFVKTSFGFVTGIEFREGLLLINEKCQQVVAPNMTFIITVGLQNFPSKKATDDSKVSIFISDTVLTCDNGPNEVLTAAAKSRFRSNYIRLRPAEEKPNEIEELASSTRTKRSVILQEQTRHKQTNEDKRKERQKELIEALNKQAKMRLSSQNTSSDGQRLKKSNISYKSDDKFPDEPELAKLMIYVDKRHDTVIVPIFGIPVPFHISMIKNASLTVEGDYTFLRINFTHPGSQIGKDNVQFPHPLAKFLKELSFKSSNIRENGETPSANLNNAIRLIKEMQKRFRTLEAEEREKEGAVKQDKLLLATNKGNPRLKDLYVRPNIIAKKISGVMEAHTNGFRYTSLRGDKIDVLYNNIKHAFFQPCDNEMIILLHFHLKHPVLWGKKKYSDIQFYTEVGEITTDLGKYHHMQDRDDMESERLEREMRKKLNSTFQNFCDKVNRLTNEKVDFDMPFNELSFNGVPFRSSVTLKPTATCLTNLTEWPPFVITLDEVELVHFERVSSTTKTFDMVIVFKDYSAKTQQVGQIPASSLDSIKDWLNSCDIPYSEGPMSLNWNNIMKTIRDDPDGFFANGGWAFITSNSDDEANEDEESEESSFAPSEDESDASDEDEEGSEENATSDDDSDVSEDELGSDESSGKDWSDLEQEAAKADKDKERGEDEGRHQHSSHHRHGGGGGDRRGHGAGNDRKRKNHHSGPAPKRRH